MKKVKLLGAAILFTGFTACALTGKDAPQPVQTAFAAKFPTVQRVKWDKENETEWEAEFRMNGKPYSANFTNDGAWKETEHKISTTEIPAAVKTTIDKEFTGYEIEEAEVSETAAGTVYEFELEMKETKMEVAIAPDGKVVKKEAIKKSSNEEKD